jgi:hypothetical protein
MAAMIVLVSVSLVMTRMLVGMVVRNAAVMLGVEVRHG